MIWAEATVRDRNVPAPRVPQSERGHSCPQAVSQVAASFRVVAKETNLSTTWGARQASTPRAFAR